MIKGKNGFWLLFVIFSAIVLMMLALGGVHPSEVVKEMDGTMGSMMLRDHASGATLGSILSKARQLSTSNQVNPSQGHHQLPYFMKVMDVGGLAAILIILPLMVGVSTVVIILWL